jgi:hypothetical protein
MNADDIEIIIFEDIQNGYIIMLPVSKHTLRDLCLPDDGILKVEYKLRSESSHLTLLRPTEQLWRVSTVRKCGNVQVFRSDSIR